MTKPEYTTVALHDQDLEMLIQALRLAKARCLENYKAATTVRDREDWIIEQEAYSALHDRMMSAKEQE